MNPHDQSWKQSRTKNALSHWPYYAKIWGMWAVIIGSLVASVLLAWWTMGNM